MTEHAAIWPAWPRFDEDEIVAAGRILAGGRVNYWTGTAGREFEQEFAQWSSSRYAVALHNGTLALECALRALGIGAGDQVIVTSRSFIASASCVVNVGALPVFADVDADSQNITVESIAAVLTPRTKVIIAVHLAGWPSDMPAIVELARQHDLKVIEDCAQAHGAAINGKSVGSFGDVAAWSFCQDKIMSTGGEGGMLTTDRKALSEKVWSYKDHGKSRAAMETKTSSSGFRWVHDSIGTNGRMLEVQAAIGRIQLTKMPDWHQRRTTNAAVWQQRLGRWPALRVPRPPDSVVHAWYKFYAFVRPERLTAGWSRDRLLAAIADAGVPCFSGSCPEIYREKAFANLQVTRRPVAAELGETSLMFLVHPTLSPEHIHQMADRLDPILSLACAE